MPTEIHCSACNAIVQAGNQFCPGCGLQLTAQAVPAVYVEGPRFPGWYIAGVILFAVFGVLYISNRISEGRQAKIDADAAATFHSRSAALSAIDTPALFQAHCGPAFRIRKNPAGFATGTIFLDYRAPAPLTVTSKERDSDLIEFAFSPSLGTASETYRGERRLFTDREDSPGIYAALDLIGCKIAP